MVENGATGAVTVIAAVGAAASRFFSLLSTHDITLLVALYLGPHAFLAAGVAARATWGTASALWPAVLRSSPRCLYVCGGYSLGDRRLRGAECLNLATGVWESLPPLSSCRGGAAAATMGGQVYVCGGCVDHQVVLSSVERFDPLVGAWCEEAPMQVGRQGAMAAVIRDRLFLCGGWGAGDLPLASAEHLRRGGRSERWTFDGVRLLEPRAWAGAGSIGSRIYFCGGQNKNDPLNSAEYWDTTTGAEEALPPMVERRSAPAAAVVATGAKGGAASKTAAAVALLVGGGWDEHRQNLRTVERFDPKANEWQTVESMHVKRFGAAACAAAGCLFIFGGYEEDDVDACLASSERLDFAAPALGDGALGLGVWRPAPAMPRARSGAVAVACWAS